jgi:hypothetical protein
VLTSFAVANFKAFGPTPPQRVALRPLTLIFGANSAGKSSLLHSLILAKNAHENGEFDVRPGCAITGDSVDLGGFRQYVHRRGESKEPVTLSFSFKAPGKDGNERSENKGFKKLRSRLLSGSSNFSVILSIKSAGSSEPRINTLTLEVDGGQLLRMGSVPVPKSKSALPKLMRIEHWETEHPVSRHFFSECLDVIHGTHATEENLAIFREAVEAVIQKVTLSAEKTLFPHDFVDRSHLPVDTALDNGNPQTDEATSQIRRSVALNFERYLGPLLQDIHDLLTISLGGLVYLGPLRNMPERHLSAEKMDGRNIAGGSAALLKVINDSELRDKINTCLGKLNTAYELRVQATLGEDDIRRWVERSVKLSLRTIIEDAVKTPAVQDEIDSIRDRQPEDFAAYVEANPDLHEQLAEYWWDAQYANLKEDEGEEVAEAYTMEDAMNDVLDTVNGSCGYYFEEILDHYLENSDHFTPLVDRYYSQSNVENIINRITEESGRRELCLFEKRTETTISLRDIGIGISQVLPVLVHAYGEQGKLIVIEQPEIHIHPALQSEIADVFIETALGEQGNTFLLETHSEHLILRIMRRIRETTRNKLPEGATPVRPEDVQVIYVETDPKSKQAHARILRIDGQGRFVDNWPNGFFEERLHELF